MAIEIADLPWFTYKENGGFPSSCLPEGKPDVNPGSARMDWPRGLTFIQAWQLAHEKPINSPNISALNRTVMFLELLVINPTIVVRVC